MSLVRYSYPNTRTLLPAFGFFGRSPWSGFESEIDRLFGSVSGQYSGRLPVEFDEDKDNAYVRAALPGVSKSDVNVEFADGNLTITGSRKQKTGGEEETVSFTRSVAVPEHLDVEKVNAAYENGVLTVTLPKKEQAKPRKIAIA